MKNHEIVFQCFYCGGDVVYGEHCTHCDAKLQWDIVIAHQDTGIVDIYNSNQAFHVNLINIALGSGGRYLKELCGRT